MRTVCIQSLTFGLRLSSNKNGVKSTRISQLFTGNAGALARNEREANTNASTSSLTFKPAAHALAGEGARVPSNKLDYSTDLLIKPIADLPRLSFHC